MGVVDCSAIFVTLLFKKFSLFLLDGLKNERVFSQMDP